MAWIIGCGLGYLFLGITGYDDKYLTYAVSRAFAEGRGLVNLDGDHVEQSSSLLYAILVGGGWRAVLRGLDLATVGHLVALASAWVALVLIGRLAMRLARPEAQPSAVAATVWIVGTCPIFVLWSLSGMETTTEAALFAAIALDWLDRLESADRTTRRWIASLALMLAYGLVRAEGPFVLIAAAAGLTVLVHLDRDRASARGGATRMLSSAVGCAAAITIGRWLYFHALLPEPAYAKVTLRPRAILDGLAYLGSAWRGVSIAATGIAVFLAARAFSSRRAGAVATVALLTSAHIAFVLFTGGDWMATGRFWVATLGPGCALLVSATRPRRAAAALVIAQLALLPGQPSRGLPPTRARPSNLPSLGSWFADRNCAHLRDATLVAHLVPLVERRLASRSGPVTIYTGEGGAPPYALHARFGERVQFIDPNGLTTRQVRSCSALADVARLNTGRTLSVHRYLRDEPQIEQTCGWPAADLIVDPAFVFRPRETLDAFLASRGFVEREKVEVDAQTCPGMAPYLVFERR